LQQRINDKPGLRLWLTTLIVYEVFRCRVVKPRNCAKVGREINPHVFTAEEFVRRKKARDHIVSTVSGTPKLFVIGSEDELEAMG